MLSWVPVLLDAEAVNQVDLFPPVAGTLAIGAQHAPTLASAPA